MGLAQCRRRPGAVAEFDIVGLTRETVASAVRACGEQDALGQLRAYLAPGGSLQKRLLAVSKAREAVTAFGNE
jgi:hypothetical protein